MRGGRERPLTGGHSGMVSGWSWPVSDRRLKLPRRRSLRDPILRLATGRFRVSKLACFHQALK